MLFALGEGIAILIFLQLVSLSTIKNKRGNLLMSAFFAVLAIVLLNDNAFLNVIGIKDTGLLNRVLFIPNLILPALFYFSIVYYVNPTRKWGRKDYYLIAPWLVHLLLIIPFLINPEIKDSSKEWHNYALIYKYFTESLFVIFIVVLNLMLLSLLKKHKKRIGRAHSNYEGVDLAWVRNLIYLAPLLLLSYVFMALIDSPLANNIGDFILVAVFFYVGYSLVRQREIHSISLPPIVEDKPLLTDTQPVQNQLLSEEQLKVLASKLETVMAEQKPYLDPNLNLHQLSVKAELRKPELSYLLNTHFEMNFYAFINHYRIEESKKILSNPEKSHFSMVGVASESGYKSKSTFYSRFKEATGSSPAEYVHNKKSRSFE